MTNDEIAALVSDAARRIRPHVLRTPVVASHGAWLKCEQLQATGSFKVRGALNTILSMPPAAVQKGVVSASTGNHARAVAHALALAGREARGTIFLPTTVAPHKLAALREYANVTLNVFGNDSGETEAYARAASERERKPFISPYNDPAVVAGQGTIGLEIMEQVPDVDSVYVAVGGGGLISGIGAALKSRRPDIRIVGCWPANAPALYATLAGTGYEELDTLSDGTAGGVEANAITIDLARRVIDETVLVSEAEIAAAMRLAYKRHHMRIEGAAGVAYAAYLRANVREANSGGSSVVVLCGGNIDSAKFDSIVQ